MAKQMQMSFPSLEEIQSEMRRARGQGRFHQALKGTLGAIVVVAAVAVLVAALALPVLRITGTSMQPEFQPSDIVVGYRTKNYGHNDIVAFYYNNKLIIKRVIAVGGELVDIDEDGRVYVNGEMLDEPYVSEHALGMCDLEFPYQVPQDYLFVMGDNRAISVDSRSRDYGCLNIEETAGKIFLRVKPIRAMTYYGSVELPSWLNWLSPKTHYTTTSDAPVDETT